MLLANSWRFRKKSHNQWLDSFQTYGHKFQMGTKHHQIILPHLPCKFTLPLSKITISHFLFSPQIVCTSFLISSSLVNDFMEEKDALSLLSSYLQGAHQASGHSSFHWPLNSIFKSYHTLFAEIYISLDIWVSTCWSCFYTTYCSFRASFADFTSTKSPPNLYTSEATESLCHWLSSLVYHLSPGDLGHS